MGGKVLTFLEHDPEKWIPVFRKDHAPTKNLDHDPIQIDWITVWGTNAEKIAFMKLP